MATNSEELQKHVMANAGVYRAAIKNGVITEDDIKAAGNAGGNYSYADQDAALQRINDAFKVFVNKNPNDERLKNFFSGIPTVQKFVPNKEDWQKYDQEQMGRLAEQMKFNWKNKDDRSEMMNILSNESIRRDKEKNYQDYKKEHPFASWVNENILAPNVSKRMERGEDITNKDIALDAANVGTYLFPGAGAAASKAGKAAMFAADAALQGGVGAASDINQGNELGIHNIAAPLIGAGAGAVSDLVPRMAKMTVDVATGGFGGRVGKPIADVAEGWITKIFGDEIGAARAALEKEAKDAASVKTVRKNASEAAKKQLQSEGISAAPNAQIKQFAKDKNFYANNPEKWANDVKSGKIKDPEKFLTDPNFRKIIGYKAPEGAAKVGRDIARGTSRQAGRSLMITQSNAARNKSATPTIEEVYSSPELLDYIRLKRRGYEPQIPYKYKDYKDEIDNKSRIENLYGF